MDWYETKMLLIFFCFGLIGFFIGGPIGGIVGFVLAYFATENMK